MEIRSGIKSFSDWPTIPQLYVKGEFVGGSDIMMEMFEAGELEQLMADAGVAGGELIFLAHNATKTRRPV